MNIIDLAFTVNDRVAEFVRHCRQFFYEVVLVGRTCPRCNGPLDMLAEGVCRCRSCARTLDPTTTFQRCLTCGGTPVLRVRRYCCSQCGADIPSHFLFDGLVFDTGYFRQKMAEHRERDGERSERLRKMLAENRSDAVNVPPADDLLAVPGMLSALDGPTGALAEEIVSEERERFDLKRYEGGVWDHVSHEPVCFDDIPALIDNERQDRIWRFVAILYMDTARLIDIWQEEGMIMVMKHEADRKGQDVS